MSAPVPLPSTAQAPHKPVLFDPDGEVKTSDRLKAVMHDIRGPMINNYVRHRQIGKGQHGLVYLCKQLNTKFPAGHPDRHIPVAMKSVKRDNHRENQYDRLRKSRLPASSDHTPVADKLNNVEHKIRREIAIMKKLIHPNVVRLYEVIDDRMHDKIYIVMEYLGGGEVKWRDSNGNPVLTTSQTRRILRDVILGLEYLHNQGIIHRDIKPANLLWTEDRRQVKIADFGVSHFSYAQRLAAAGDTKVDKASYESILLDETGISRRSGTPAFLAPELIYEHTAIVLPGRTPRPPITKAIDIWALGITLYCLLFGCTPFSGVNGTEYNLYSAACNDDWNVLPVMGSDKLRTGGRFPRGDSEGTKIICLLDQMLQKNYRRRVSLSKVKTNPWVLTDLKDPDYWLKVTLKPEKINVSVEETSDAMSTVHFRYNWSEKIARHVSSLFRTSRSPPPNNGLPRLVIDNAAPSNGKQQAFPAAFTSDPVGHRPSPRPADTTNSTTPLIARKRDKDKGKAVDSPNILRNPSFNSTLNFKRNDSVNATNLVEGTSLDCSPSSATATAQTPYTNASSRDPKSRRGSISRTIERVASGSLSMFGSGSGASSPKHLSPGSSSVGGLSGEKKARFINLLQNISSWRPTKFTSNAPQRTQGLSQDSAPVDNEHLTGTDHTRSLGPAVGVAAAAAGSGQGPSTRRSEEALRYYRQPQDAEDAGALTAVRRASSWGQGDKELTDMVSVQSLEQILAEHVMNVGAGGLSNSNIPPIPRVTSDELAATYSHDPGPRQEEDGGREVEGVSTQEEVSLQDSESSFARRYGLPAEHDDWSSLGSFEEQGEEGGEYGGDSATVDDEEGEVRAVPLEVVHAGLFSVRQDDDSERSGWDEASSQDDGDDFEEEEDSEGEDEEGVTFSPRPRRQLQRDLDVPLVDD